MYTKLKSSNTQLVNQILCEKCLILTTNSPFLILFQVSIQKTKLLECETTFNCVEQEMELNMILLSYHDFRFGLEILQ